MLHIYIYLSIYISYKTHITSIDTLTTIQQVQNIIIMVSVDDSARQLFYVSCVILGLTILRLLHLFPNNEFWATETLFIFFGTCLVEAFNYYIPNVWLISQLWTSVISIIVATLFVQFLYSTFAGTFVAAVIIAAIIATCYTGQTQAVDWINSWLPFTINATIFIAFVVICGIMAYVIYKCIMRWTWLQTLVCNLIICFSCALSIDVLYEYLVTNTDDTQLDILTFDTTFLIIFGITIAGYYIVVYITDKYLPDPLWKSCRSKKEKDDQALKEPIKPELSFKQYLRKLATSSSNEHLYEKVNLYQEQETNHNDIVPPQTNTPITRATQASKNNHSHHQLYVDDDDDEEDDENDTDEGVHTQLPIRSSSSSSTSFQPSPISKMFYS